MQGVLVFLAGSHRLCVAVGDVLKLVVEGPVTPIPFGHTALAGVIDAGDGAITPVFDLRGLTADAVPTHVEGAMVAVIPTSIGPIGLRLDRLLGTAARYTASAATSEQPAPAGVSRVVDGVGKADGTASASIGDDVFWFFSTDAFIAAVGLAG